MQNRSSHYDWFKGKNPKDQKNGWKANVKTTWKFTRLFLFFSVFFFSMWGCVQTFTSKTNPMVGMGTELYASKDQIAPNVTSFHIKEDNAGEIYLSQSNDNVWFNKKQDEEFEEMQIQYQDKGVESLDEALNGGNGLARLVLEDKEGEEEIKYVQELGTNKIAVASSLFENKDKYIEEPTQIQSFINPSSYINLKYIMENLRLYSVNDDNNLSESSFRIHFPLISEFKTWNQIYNASIVNEIINFKIGDNDESIGQNLLETPVKNENETGDQFAKRVSNHNNTILNIARIMFPSQFWPSFVDADWSETSWNINDNYYGYTNSGYVPIATWGQAFEMGRGSGPFYGIFVYPLAYLTNILVDAMPFMAGWESFFSIVIIVVVVSLIIFGLSFKGTLQQTKMQELNAKKAIIEAKYSAYQGNKQMENRKRQEIADMYKKEGINPVSSLKIIFIQMPLFLAMWRVVGTIQHIKGTTWLGINFAATSYQQLFAGEWQYLPLLIIAGATNILSQYYPRLLTRRRDKNRINIHQKEAMKKSNRTQNIMMVVFTFMTLIFSAGLQVYFIIRSMWRICETTLTHNILQSKKKKRISKKIKVKKTT